MKFFFTRSFLSFAVSACLFGAFSSGTAYGQAMMGKYVKDVSTSGSGGVLLSDLTHTTPSLPVSSQHSTGRESKNKVTGNVPGNYTTFSAPVKNTSSEAVRLNAGYEDHPEAGMLFSNAPCTNCYELIGKRTEYSKTFLKEGTSGTDGGKDILVQSNTMPMHYKDSKGNWLTVKTALTPDNARHGVYAATAQPVPVVINTNNGDNFSSLGKEGKLLEFNHNLELIFAKPDGSIVSLGNANWTNHTAGDEGVYVINAWPGIDIEMHTVRGAVKTNFYINHSMPEYAGGKLLIRDHLKMDNGLTLFADGKSRIADNLSVKNAAGQEEYVISSANACEKNNIKNTMQLLDYYINGNELDIAVPGDFLNRPAASYPVIIDPLVSVTTVTTPVNGSSYSAALAPMSGCAYYNAATTPANCTLTDIRYAFIYVTNSGAWLTDGSMDFYITGGCRSPAPPTGFGGLYWFCNYPGPGTCTADGTAPYTMFADFGACIPAPQCAPHDLGITMYFYETLGAKTACGPKYINSGSDLSIIVEGHTVEFVSATASPASICLGGTSSLTAVGTYGVPPYTFTWTPGPLTGSPVTVSPATTTTYNLTITDACGITATGTTTVVVNIIAPITGTTTLCVGNTTTLADATGGAHSWTSSNPGVATITSPGGVVSAISPGTTTITFTNTATGCTSTTVVTVIALPTAILGTRTVCVGGTTSLTDATAGGLWSSSAPGTASISGTGVVSGVAAGTATITYGSATCYVTAIVTVSAVTPITGTLSVCPGGTTPLFDATAGGTWSSGSTGIATIGLGTGVVTGVTAGTSTIVYTTAAGCTTTAVVTVNPISPITGILSLCAGSTSTLADATPGGTWSSSNTVVATIGLGTGLVSGLTNGTSTIVYTTAAGCTATAVVTVTPLSPISGILKVCQGSTTTLTDAAGGGTWSSGSPGIATIGVGTGVVSGIAGGTSTIVYTTAAGCTTSAVVTVNPISPITGTLSLCAGSTSTLADAAPGGTWSSGTPAVATIGLGTGLVSALTNGTTTVVYTTAAGCTASAVVTVTPLAPISGTLSVCQGSTTTLTDAAGGGTWNSGSTGIATIGVGTGVVTGVAGGTSTIVYTTAAGCTVSAVVTVNPTSPITGTLILCAGSTSNLADATPGGTWNSVTPAVATIGIGTGLVTAVSNGTTTVIYTTAAGCTVSAVVTVNPLLPITGTLTVCQGGTTTLADAAGGGTWSSGSPTVAGIGLTTGLVSGLSGGTSTIVYTTGAGCSVNAVVTVNPITPITGITTVCIGGTSVLNDATGGGTWSSTNPGVASISTTGLVSGLSAGTTTISYVTPAGCSATITFTVVNVAPITGIAVVCVGNTTNLADATGGGTWSSGTLAVATIGLGSGVVTGVSGGTAIITYTSGAGCTSTRVVTVNAVPSAILGITNVCVGLTTSLSDATSGGTWSSSTPGIASVNAGGIVTGAAAGVATITYTLPGGCYITVPVVVNPLPDPIGGSATVCLGSSTSLNDASAGGTWVSSNTSVATIDASGLLTGITAGTSTITYTLGTGCQITGIITVIPLSAMPLTENVDYCQNDAAVPLIAIGTNLVWYTVPTGGVGLPSAPVPPTNIPGVTTWYVSQNVTGCEGARAPLQVTVHVHPIFSIVPARPTACQGDTISFTYSGPTFPGEVYSWTLPSNGVLYTGSSLADPSITMFYDTVVGSNYIMLTVGDGYAACNAKDTLAMTVYINSPDAAFYVKPNVCFGDSVTIALSHIGAGVTDYTWDFGGATLLVGSSNHGGPFIVTFPAAGIYSVTLTAISNLNCPSVPIRDTIDVHALPSALFDAVPKSTGTLCLEDSILFVARFQDATCSYLWQPTHCFNNNNKPEIWGKLEQGRTEISLTVTDPFGCSATASQQFNPDACCTVLFPNAFSPNGDGKNDKFRPIFNGYHNFHEFRIVNRWGQTVFESANSLPEWDGAFGGVPQDMGVYYYYIKYDCGGNIIEEKGDVTLVR